MTINPIRPDIARIEGTQPTRATQGGDAASLSSAAPAARRSDTVQISAEGLAKLAAENEALSSGSLPPERLADIREKIGNGTYKSDAVAYTVAQRILQSGDL